MSASNSSNNTALAATPTLATQQKQYTPTGTQPPPPTCLHIRVPREMPPLPPPLVPVAGPAHTKQLWRKMLDSATTPHESQCPRLSPCSHLNCCCHSSPPSSPGTALAQDAELRSNHAMLDPAPTTITLQPLQQLLPPLTPPLSPGTALAQDAGFSNHAVLEPVPTTITP
jgi:hypothetical protein